MKERCEYLLKLWGLAYPYAMAVILYYSFLIIFLNEGGAVITINNHGEAIAEFLVIPITLVAAGIGQLLIARDLKVQIKGS